MRVIQLISSEGIDGSVRSAATLSRALAARGADCRAVVRRKSPAVELLAESDVKVTQERMGLLGDLVLPGRIASQFPAEGPYAVHVHSLRDCRSGLRAIQLGDRRRGRLVASLHHLPASLSAAERVDLDGCSAIIVESEEGARQLRQAGYDAGSRLHVIAPGVAAGAHTPPLPYCMAQGNSPLTFAYVGAMDSAHGADLVIDAFAALRDLDVRLLMVGEGRGRDVMPLLRKLRGEKLDDRVEWLGLTTDVAPALARADVGVFAARGPESFSRGLAECLAAGRPAVSTALPSRKEMADGVAEFIAAPSKELLAAAMRRLASCDRPTLQRLGAQARERMALAYDQPRFVDAVTTLYH